jgi:hypothetical protein
MGKSYFDSVLAKMVTIKNFKQALNLCNDQDEIQAYLNQFLSPTNRISKEEISYSMAVSNSHDIDSSVKACVYVLNNLLLMEPFSRFKRIESNLKAAKADMVAEGNNVYEVFYADLISLVEFFQDLASNKPENINLK